MKGIILAGGAGTRMYPMTSAVCKQLLPVYDKPMIYYPLSALMHAGIRDILIISTPSDTPLFTKVLGDGSSIGCRISYEIQKKPGGLAEAFIIGASFTGNSPVCLVLGDNIFYGDNFPSTLRAIVKKITSGATRAMLLTYPVRDPERYGIAELDKEGRIVSLEEKPATPRSNHAVVGIYFYNSDVVRYAKKLKPSPRGEIEITDLNKCYLADGGLSAEMLGRGFAWLDAGTPASLVDAALFIKAIEERQGFKIACIEEIAMRMQFVSPEHMRSVIKNSPPSDYRSYINSIINEIIKN